MSNSRFMQWLIHTWLTMSDGTASTLAIGNEPARKSEQVDGAFEDIRDLQRYPLSCEELKDGLLFHFSDGTSKFIPDCTPRLSEPKGDANASE
jgi:hypothetical protein